MAKDFIEVFSKWEPNNQAVFIFLILAMILSFTTNLILFVVKYIAIIFRGWPEKCYEEAEDWEDEDGN